MVLTFSGNLTSVRFLQPANAHSPIAVRLSGSVMEASAVQPVKVLSQTSTAVSGNETEVRPVHFENAPLPIVARFVGKSTSVSFLQPSNAYLPSAVIVSGSEIEGSQIQ